MGFCDNVGKICNEIERYVVCFVFTLVLLFCITSAWLAMHPWINSYFLYVPSLYLTINICFHFFVAIYLRPPKPHEQHFRTKGVAFSFFLQHRQSKFPKTIFVCSASKGLFFNRNFFTLLKFYFLDFKFFMQKGYFWS